MKREIIFVSLLSAMLLSACTTKNETTFTQVSSTMEKPWSEGVVEASEGATKLAYTISLDDKGQKVDGFGACFNELGWTSLSLLSPEERTEVLTELFAPNTGANFNICRMPVAANDFSTDWYSYNETEGDFEMKNFSIEHDKSTLIPFIHSALEQNPDIKIWASPWCPPSWLKHNKHYASKYNANTHAPEYHNGLAKDKEGFEGTDMFIVEPEYLDAYALYFEKFIKAYDKEGIDIFAVMPQNEFNSAQVFPSCCWTAPSLGKFIGEYLGPKMEALGVDVMIGTVERADDGLVTTMLNQKDCSKYVKGIGFQWAGKGAVGAIHQKYPDMKLYQTEQECGNGKNDWAGTTHSWDLLKHYFDNGVSTYLYWNISLMEGGISRWGWAQNSLVVVDPTTKSYRFTPEYYLMKHISHYVKPDAQYVATPEGFEGLVFQNPEGEIVILYMEKNGENTSLELTVNQTTYTLNVAANSINTFIL